MTETEFYSLASEHFSTILSPYGFTSIGSKHCVFYREVCNEIYHFIVPNLGQGGTWYDVRVFPHSPYIDPRFDDRFPDALSVPTDSWSCLSEHDGVNLTQQQFNCKNETNFRSSFRTRVGPALIKFAIPYLDRFQSVSDLIPVIRHSSFMGFALHHVGRYDEAHAALQRERERLQRLDTSNIDIAVLLESVERLLRLNNE